MYSIAAFITSRPARLLGDIPTILLTYDSGAQVGQGRVSHNLGQHSRVPMAESRAADPSQNVAFQDQAFVFDLFMF